MNKPDILQTLRQEDIDLQQRGKLFWASCPLHSDKTPSFKIDTERQTFYCFGCHAKGDAISFIMQYKGFSFKDACRYLGINGDVIKIKPPIEDRKKRLTRAFRQWERDYSDHVSMMLRRIRRVMEHGFKDMDEAAKYSSLFHALPIYEYHYEILCTRDAKAKYELFQEAGYEWL